jgi:hypothetical protein
MNSVLDNISDNFRFYKAANPSLIVSRNINMELHAVLRSHIDMIKSWVTIEGIDNEWGCFGVIGQETTIDHPHGFIIRFKCIAATDHNVTWFNCGY